MSDDEVLMTHQLLTKSRWPASTTGELIDLSVGQLLRDVANEVPDQTAIVIGDSDPARRSRWTYQELLNDAERIARALAAEFEPGEHVAIWSGNRAEFELAQLGAALAGLTLVMVNPALVGDEVHYILDQSQSVGIFVDDNYSDHKLTNILEKISSELTNLRKIISFSDLDEFVATASNDRPLPTVEPNSIAQIQYTSGTTGKPKGALLRHNALVTNANLSNIRTGADIGSVFINSLPMFHVAGSTLNVIGAIVRRGTHVLLPRFDPALALELVEKERGNIMITVPTIMHMMLEHPTLHSRDLSSLRTIFCAGANVPIPAVERARREFGCNFTNAYGMTEAHGTAIQTTIGDDAVDIAETVGTPLPHIEVKIADINTGDPVPIGALGEIRIRGYQVMSGYFNKDEETASTIDEDDWLHTGDLGSMDQRGFVKIRSRIKEMIIRGGENVYPAEIENVIATRTDIDDVHVVGVPDEKWGEVVCAVIRPATEAKIEGNEIYEFCRERLAGFKVPRMWYVLDEFPTTASGKVQKFVLRQRISNGDIPTFWSKK